MTTAPELVAVDPETPDPALIARAAAIIRRGGLVGMPTETVYGLAANALDPDAIARIYAAKGRPRQNPLIAHVASVAAARELAAEWPTMADALTARFWPGPLTLLVRRKAIIPNAMTAGLDTVGVRMPDHPVALALIRASGTPLAAPSANRFTEVSPVTAHQVARGLGAAVDLILDAGRTRVGLESTVVDVSGGTPLLLRPGMIAREAIEEVVGPLGRTSTSLRSDVAHPAPGMSHRHYAPRATVRLVTSDELQARLADLRAESVTRRIGIVTCQTALASIDTQPFALVAALGENPSAYAAELYATLHRADEAQCEELYVERPPESPAWDAIHDRLRRAAHPG
jgi:L-threonylcarbamoyladenylate synthase